MWRLLPAGVALVLLIHTYVVAAFHLQQPFASSSSLYSSSKEGGARNEKKKSTRTPAQGFCAKCSSTRHCQNARSLDAGDGAWTSRRRRGRRGGSRSKLKGCSGEDATSREDGGTNATWGENPLLRSSAQHRPARATRDGLRLSAARTTQQWGVGGSLPYPVRVAILGGGNFGLAMSFVLARNQVPSMILVRTQAVADHINIHHEHPMYLQGIKLPFLVRATTDPFVALNDATYIVHAVPVQYSRKFLQEVVTFMPPGAPILSVSKGIETDSLCLMKDILVDVCGAERGYAFLSGPSFAQEIANNLATAVVVASNDRILANDFSQVLANPNFRCFTSSDVVGVEVGGAVKNVIALAAGMCEGLGLGTNAMAALVTRGCGEMRRLSKIMGGSPETLSGLSGVGDTFGTCFGPLSRNRNFGIRLGKGESMEDILASTTEVAEGVATSLALAELIPRIDNSYRIDLKYSIIFGVADILTGNLSPREGLIDLMAMPLRAEM